MLWTKVCCNKNEVQTFRAIAMLAINELAQKNFQEKILLTK